MPLERKADVPSTMKDFIRQWGAPAVCLSDSAAENKIKDIQDIERNFNISRHHYSEPGYQNQNWGERKISDNKIWLITSWILQAHLLIIG